MDLHRLAEERSVAYHHHDPGTARAPHPRSRGHCRRRCDRASAAKRSWDNSL